MIVNQTDVDIAVKTQADGVSTHKDKERVIIVKRHTNEYFYSSSFKACIKVKGYCKKINDYCLIRIIEWSKIFDGTTQGLSGYIEVKSIADDIEIKDKFLNFGMIFENGVGSYSRTKIIKIVPRYIIYNALDDDIKIRQKNHSREIRIPSSERTQVYNFQNREKDPFILISDAGPDLAMFEEEHKSAIIEEDSQAWSSPFSIEDIGDF